MAEFVVRRNVDGILLSKNTNVTLPVCQAGAEWRRNEAINGLECSEKEGFVFGA